MRCRGERQVSSTNSDILGRTQDVSVENRAPTSNACDPSSARPIHSNAFLEFNRSATLRLLGRVVLGYSLGSSGDPDCLFSRPAW